MMKRNKRNWWIFALCLATSVSYADTQQKGFGGSGELGFVSASGNTNTQTLSAKLHGTWKSDRWQDEVSLSTLHVQDRAVSDSSNAAKRWQLTGQSNYILSPSSYVLAALRHADDAYATYDQQTALSVGYGYEIVNTPTVQVAVELGPGRRISRYAATSGIYNENITRIRLRQNWRINDRVSWDNWLTREAGPKEALLSFQSGLQIAVMDNLAVKLLYEWRNTNAPAPGKMSTDILTTANLVYSFN